MERPTAEDKKISPTLSESEKFTLLTWWVRILDERSLYESESDRDRAIATVVEILLLYPARIQGKPKIPDHVIADMQDFAKSAQDSGMSKIESCRHTYSLWGHSPDVDERHLRRIFDRRDLKIRYRNPPDGALWGDALVDEFFGKLPEDYRPAITFVTHLGRRWIDRIIELQNNAQPDDSANT